jgi:hypothetical protein
MSYEARFLTPNQLKQVAEFMTWCSDPGIKPDHLPGQHE